MTTLLFTSAGFTSPAPKRVGQLPLRLTTLKQLFPIRELKDDVLETFAMYRVPEMVSRGSILFREGDPVDSMLYLLSGTVSMRPEDGKSERIEAGTTRSRFPLGCGDVYGNTAVAVTDLEILPICPSIMSHYVSKDGVGEVVLNRHDPSIPASVRNSRLFQAVSHQFADGDIEIPPLPGISSWVARSLEEQRSGREMARIMAWDPILSGKLCQLANSPLYFARREVRSCRAAIRVVGAEAAQRLLINTCIRQRSSGHQPLIRTLLSQFWKRSVLRAAVCQILAHETGIDPCEARLAGLIADIGVVPYLYFVDSLSQGVWTDEEVIQALPFVRTQVGTALLRNWHLPEDMADIVALSRLWHSDTGPELSLSDIVILANLLIGAGSADRLVQPPIHTVPAWKKFGEGKLTPAYALTVLQQAKNQITALALDQVDPATSALA